MNLDQLRARLKEDAQRLRSSGAPAHRDVADRIDKLLKATEATSRVIENLEIDLQERGDCESTSCLIWSHTATLLRQEGFAKGVFFDEHFAGTSLGKRGASES